MRKSLFSLFTILYVLAPTLGTLVPMAGRAGAYSGAVKGSGPTVYWLAWNGKRYVFPTQQTYTSWRGPNDSIVTLPDAALSTIPIGGNVTYRPGVRLIKIQTDPKVYAVSRYGTLRWITSESLAAALYGANWSRWVDDIPDEFFVNYTVGTPIWSSSDYQPSVETNAVKTPEDNLSDQASTHNPTATPVAPQGNFRGSVTFTAAPNEVHYNESVNFLVTVSNPSTSVQNLTIKIYDAADDHWAKTCQGTFTCSLVLTFSRADGASSSAGFYAVVTNELGQELPRTWSNTISITPPVTATPATEGSLSVDRTSITSGEMTRFTFTAPSSIPTENIYVEFWKDNMGPRVWSCAGVRTCTGSAANWSNGYADTHYYAQVYNRPPGSSGTGTYVTTLTSPLIRFTSYTVCPSTICTYPITPGPLSPGNVAPAVPVITSPIQNQILTNYPRALTATWTSSAKKHLIQIDCDYCHSLTQWSNSPSYSYTTDNGQTSLTNVVLPGDNQFRLRVKAVNENGVESAWSEYVYFRYNTWNASSGAITSVSASLDPTSANACGYGFGVIGTITVNGPASVTYTFDRSDGAIAPNRTLTFTSAGSKTVTDSWYLSGTYTGWLQLRTIAPNVMTSDRVSIQSICN